MPDIVTYLYLAFFFFFMKGELNNSYNKRKKEIKGKITAVRGRKGAVRVYFERGMPGQSVGAKVKIE